MATNPVTNQPPPTSPAQDNMTARAAVLRSSIKMRQRIFSSTFVPSANGNVLNIVPRNVGMITGFWVKVAATVAATGSGTATPTGFNVANLLQQVVFNDLNNYVRINTAGWHLNMVNTARAHHPFGGSFNGDSPIGYGNNYAPFVAPNITAGTPVQVEAWFHVPLAYNSRDLRGAVYANVINATMNLQLTLNSNVVAPAGAADTTLYIYKGGTGVTGGSITSTSVTVYQEFLDQLPVGQKGVILPYQDLSTIYELKNTALTGLSSGLDFPIPYANFRSFLSTCFIYDNGGVLTAGSDLNYIAIQSANFTNIMQVEPQFLAIMWRNKIFTDFPTGSYYIDHRDKPINTVQYGNIELLLNPAGSVSGSAVVLVGYEDMGLQNTIIPAGSLPGG